MYGELPLIDITGADGKTDQVPGFPVEILNPPKLCVLRLPKTDELLSYLGAERQLYRDLGRRMGESEYVLNPKAELELFGAIRIDKNGPEFDAEEAKFAIGSLLLFEVRDCIRDGQQYVITISTRFGRVAHTLSIPFQRDLAEYRRNVYKSRDLPHNLEERRFPPEVPCKLWDKVMVSVDGYADGTAVPPHHKKAAVNEMVQALIALDPQLDPNS